MNKFFYKKDSYGYKQYDHRKNNHFKRPYNNNYFAYKQKYKNTYDLYEENYYDNEAELSTKAPSTKDGSFSQSSNSNSRKQSYCEKNNENNENNRDSSIIVLENNSLEKSKIVNVPKINLSEKELKTAFFKPKNFKERA